MATINDQLVISVNVDAGKAAASLAAVNKEIEATKAQQKALKEAISEGNDEYGRNTQLLVENKQKLYDLNRTAAALEGQITQNTTANKTYGDSIKEQAGLLKSLKDQYQGLTKAQRESAEGKQLRDQIKALDTEIKGADASIGNFQRNVGDYSNQIANIAGLFGGGGGAAKGFASGIAGVTQGFKAMTGVPVVAIIGAIIGIFDRLKAALTKSEAQTMRWNEVMAAMRPLIDKVQNGITQLANVIIAFVEGAVKVATATLNGLAKAADWVGSIFGKDWGLSAKTEELKAQAKAQRDLVAAENEYALAKRNFVVEEAEAERDIADLRSKVAEKDKYTAKERKDMLNEAIRREESIAQRRKELAEENLRLLELEAARTENDAAVNDELAAAKAEVIKADTDLAKKKKELNAQAAELANTIKNEEAAAWKAAQERIKEYREEMGRLIEALPTINDMIDASAKRQAEATEEIRKSWERVVIAVQEVEDVMPKAGVAAVEVVSTLEEQQPTALERLQHAWSQYGDIISDTTAELGNSFCSIGDMYQQVADDETKSDEERAKAARKAKGFAVAQLASNSAVALSKSIAAAADLPFPANLASIASSVATILAFIAQAKSLLQDADGFETGGIIGGVHGATMGRDNTIIKARNGEQVINAQGQRRLLDVVNGVTATESTTSALVRAMSAMPAPVLDYREFTDFQSRVATMTEEQQIR